MAVALENIPVTTITARSIISAIYQTAKLITSIPNVSYHNKASVPTWIGNGILCLGLVNI